MATAAEVLLPLRPGLVPVPAIGQAGVCRYCHSACEPEYRQCHPCLLVARSVGAVDILPISMSIEAGSTAISVATRTTAALRFGTG